MANVKAILTQQNKDTPTILAIKEDTANINNKLSGVTQANVTEAINITIPAILNKLTLEERDIKRYGYKIKKSNANSSTRVEYLYDAIGMTPATMDMNTGVLNYGSWSNIWFIRDNYPCMVKYDGTEDYRLDPNDYSKTVDGLVSDYNNTSYDGNAMSAIPLVWVKRYEDEEYEYTIFAEAQYDESYKAYAHTNKDGIIKNVAYHAMFKGSLIDGKLRSIAGQRPQNSTTAQQEINYAVANGDRWNIKYWSLHVLICDLLTLILKNDNSAMNFSYGFRNYPSEVTTGSADLYHDTGLQYNKGQFYGSSSKNTEAADAKVFHIEHFWGERWERMLGLIQINGIYYAKMTPENSGYNLTGSGYIQVSAPAHPITYNSDSPSSFQGYQKANYNCEYGRLPIYPYNGSSSTYIGDYYWMNNTKGRVNVAYVGGHCSSGAGAGPRCLYLHAVAGDSRWNSGASLTLV